MSSEFKAVLVNEATGEIEYLTQDFLDVVDTSLGSVSHEVEVVTVDDFRRRIRNSTSTTQSIVKPLVTPLLSPSSSSTSTTANPNQPAVLRSTPTLLRNSRTSGRNPLAVGQPQVTQAQLSQSQQISANVSGNEVIFVPDFQLEAAAAASTPSALPPASAQFLRAVDSGSGDGTQLIVYNCAENQFDLIGDENVQLRLCQVLQDESEGGSQSTIYICEQEDGSSFCQEDDYSNIQVVEELPILQDEHGNVYEVEQFQPQVELELPVPVPAKKRKKVVLSRPTDVSKASKEAPPGRMSKRSLNELKCMEVDCSFSGMNIAELRKHLTTTHALPFDEEVIIFSSEKDFKLWRDTYERERMVSFIFRGGTKKISRDQAVTYLICHRSGHYKPTMKDQSLRKRKMKPQGSCKMNGYCTAGIKLLKNLESGEVRCEICHTHYGHPLDNGAIPHLRVNNVLRKIIWKKFEEGMTFNQVVQYLHHNPDHLEGLRLLDRRAVRNIYDKFRKNPDKRFIDDDFDSEELSRGHSPELLLPHSPEAEPVSPENHAPQIKQEVMGEPDKCGMESEDHPPQDKPAPSSECRENEEDTISSVRIELVHLVSPESGPPPTPRKRGKQSLKEKQTTESEPVRIRRSTRERKPKLFPDDELPLSKPVRIKIEPVDKGDELEKTPSAELEPPILEKITSVPVSLDEHHEPPVLTADDGEETVKKSSESEMGQEEATTAVQNNDNVKTPEGNEKPAEKKMRRKSVSEANAGGTEVEELITDGLKKTIQNLLQHGESGPTVLMYKKHGTLTPEYGRKDPRMHKDDFILIIQTPVQRQLMQMFSDVVNIDCHKGRPRDLKLMWVIVLDEFREAIPVAWLISNSTDDRIVSIFLRVLHSHTGDVQTHYVMAPIGSDHCHLWSSVFKCNPQLILNEEETKRDMRIEVAETFSDTNSRRILNGLMNDMMVAFEETAFTAALGEFEKFLLAEHGEKGKTFLTQFESNWLSRRAEWDLVHRVGAPVNTIHTSDAFGKLKKFIAFKGTKILNSCIDPVLKIGYDKCFSRSKRIFKGDQKVLKVMEDLEMQHCWGAEIDPSNFSVTGSFYTVKSADGKTENKVFPIHSPCRCKFICPKCQICMHQYVCDCPLSSTEHSMCSHTHFVHLNVDHSQPTETSAVITDASINTESSEAAEGED